MFTLLLTPAGRGGHEGGSVMASSPAARSEASLGATVTAPDLCRSTSYDSATDDDLRRCARCGESQEYCHGHTPVVTDLQGPPSERTPEEKLWDFKTRAQQYARDRGSCDDVRISYLEFLETEAEDDLALARMIAG
jgi:hypothetical protein